MSSKPRSNTPRFRTIKKHQSHPSKAKQANTAYTSIAKEIFIVRRLKALLVDVFMIYTPILYGAYWILGSGQEFRQSQLAIFLCFGAYACVCAIFIAISGQTPGLRYVRLKLVDKSFLLESNPLESSTPSARVGFWRAFVRVFVWAFSCAIVVGFVAPFLSKSHQCLHDSLMRTKIIDIDKPAQAA